MKPRFGPPKNLNDVNLNFEYKGICICELQIKLSAGPTPVTYYANHLVYEIERVCASKDRFKLFEAYGKALLHPTDHGLTVDSTDDSNVAEDL